MFLIVTIFLCIPVSYGARIEYPNVTITKALHLLHEAVGLSPCHDAVESLIGLIHLGLTTSKFHQWAEIQVIGWFDGGSVARFKAYLLPIVKEINKKFNYLRTKMLPVLGLSKADDLYEEFKYSLRGLDDSQIAYTRLHFVERFSAFSRDRAIQRKLYKNYTELQPLFPSFENLETVKELLVRIYAPKLQAITNLLREANRQELKGYD